MIDSHFKLLDVDKIFGTVPMNIAIDTVILAAHEKSIETGKGVAPLH